MKVRRPPFDFSATPARWSAIPEFAQSMNASSLWIPHLERFLNRVLARATASLDAGESDTARLKSEVRTFIRQESNHYALHASFNEILTRDGYDVAGLEREFEAAFAKLFETRSLRFLCAYCEGFETMGPPAAIAWLDEMDDLLEGADPEAVALWKWHLMEEYEHRTVCHDVFHAVRGGYFLRIYGLFFQAIQLAGFSSMVRRHLLERDRATMTAAERRGSIRRERVVLRRIAWGLLPRTLKALSPFYTPRKAREPRMFRSYRESVDARLA